MDLEDYKEADEAALAMEERGGSFVQALGRAMKRADMDNTEKLKEAFPDYFEAYKGKVDEGIVEVDKYEDEEILTPEQLEGLKHDLGKLKDKFSDEDIDHLAERLDNTKNLLYGGEE